MKRRAGTFTAGLLLAAIAVAGGANAVVAVTIDRGACDLASPGFPETGIFAEGTAEGFLLLRKDGTLGTFRCSGTVPELGLFTGFHGGSLIGLLELSAGATSVVGVVDCVVNTNGTNGLSLSCRPGP